MDDLLARLRAVAASKHVRWLTLLGGEAADRIEQLEAELAEQRAFRVAVLAALEEEVTDDEAAAYGCQCALDLAAPVLARIQRLAWLREPTDG